jgi:hypothetical protein
MGTTSDELDGWVSGLVNEVVTDLYGPRYCAHCKQVQPVQTYKLEGSDYSDCDGMVYKAGFTGAHVCTVCLKLITSTVPEDECSK